MNVWQAQTDDEIKTCYSVMRQLRPHYTVAAFVARVRFQQGLGYHLVCLEGPDGPLAVAGYQIRETLIDGRFLHVDDLVTDDGRRSRGHGGELLAWLIERARDLECDSLQLDSGVHREDAHRFYEREGLTRTAYHFSQQTRERGTA